MNQTLGMDPAQAVLADVELTGVGPSRRNSPAETHVEGTHLHERSLQGSAQRGCLAHFLKNRFYIGEVGYRGETHTGGHASIIDRPTFDAVQALLAQNARARQVRLNDSPAILMGRIFDDRGNRMTPSHSNRQAVSRHHAHSAQAGERCVAGLFRAI